MEQYDRIYRGDRDRRTRAEIAWHAGVPLQSFKKLTTRQIDEVWFGIGWLLRPHLNPAIGRVVDEGAVTAMMAPQKPAGKPQMRRAA